MASNIFQTPRDTKLTPPPKENTAVTLFDFKVLFENGKKCFLGKGSFASVFKSINGKDGKVYALKIAR